VQPFGFFVQLDELFVDGLVPIRSLADDYYLYESDAHRLVGEHKRRVFQLADAVEVQLTGVSLRHRGLDFKIAGMPDAPVRSEGRGKERSGKERGKERGERRGREEREPKREKKRR
jgi:ribonuclease R